MARSTDKLSGVILLGVGLSMIAILLHSALVEGRQVGGLAQGVGVGVVMAASGIYTLWGGEYALLVRAVWSVLFVIGSLLPLFILLGAAQAEFHVFLAVSAVLAVIYVGLVGSTALDIVRAYR